MYIHAQRVNKISPGAIMADDEDSYRRTEEAEALFAFYGEDFLSNSGGASSVPGTPLSPLAAAAASAGLAPPRPDRLGDGPWLVRVGPDTALAMELPTNYPSESLPKPRLLAMRTGSASRVPRGKAQRLRDRELLEALQDLAIPGFEAAILWAEHCRSEIGEESTGDSYHRQPEGQDRAPLSDPDTANSRKSSLLHVISSHHLLKHAPDNFLSRGGTKYKLRGIYRYGTPGLAFCIGDEMSVEDFMDGLAKKMPKKKFEVVLCRETGSSIDGWNEATMGQIRDLLTEQEHVSIFNLK